METIQEILELSPIWGKLNPLEQFNLIIEMRKKMQRTEKIEVQIRDGKGQFSKIWEGNDMDKAKKIKNNFRMQGGRARAIIFKRS